MPTDLSSVAIGNPVKPKFVGSARGEEKFAFLYVVIAAGAVASAMIYGGIAGLSWSRTFLALLGCLIVGWAILFSILEVRRISRAADSRPTEALVGPEPYPTRIVVVQPPTGDAYPHHEDYNESQGFDQGQLTSRIADTTPFVERLLRRWRK